MTSASHLWVGHIEQFEGPQTHPWEVENTAYEERKLAVASASLPRMRYRSAFEAGSSIGGFTELLAVRCDQLLWNDLAPSTRASEAQSALRGGDRHGGLTISDQWPP